MAQFEHGDKMIRNAALALDPIHIGTGEFRLGRVDNTIVRDPGSGLPKIPGSSLAGAARAYMAMRCDGKYLRETERKLQSCAGKGGGDGMDHCGLADCPVCTAFGFSRNGKSFQGLAMFTDARILLFPVATMMGPVWVTSPGTLVAAGEMKEQDATEWEKALRPSAGDYRYGANAGFGARLNLGWLYLRKADTTLELAAAVGADSPPDATLEFAAGLPAEAAKRCVLVHDDMFSGIVEDNLEVRTSVSIEPATGTAAGGALFTAEAIPRTTVLWLEFAVLDGSNFRVPDHGAITATNLTAKVEKALQDMETMGVGGLNTRGMGRLRVRRWEGKPTK